jgi:hypothetical protein
MSKLHCSIVVGVLFIVMMLFSAVLLPRTFSYPFAPASVSPFQKYAILDLVGTVAGFRRFTSDIAWLQLLQYYGGSDAPLDEEDQLETSWLTARVMLGVEKTEGGHVHPVHTHSHGDNDDCSECHEHHVEDTKIPYADLKTHICRITNLDPFFSYAYQYGGAALAWNLKRPDEAIELLKNAIASMDKYRDKVPEQEMYHPFWQYQLYISAIIYKQSGDFVRMASVLQALVDKPGTPNMIKVVLANIYEKDGRYMPALALWMKVHDSGDPMYRQKSSEKLLELKEKLHL